ncbi:MAG: hypothetical protein IMF09_08555 [Proteobacteria bacterium]|nr:hypothetical protein [Pseudomonadota bacterium]
MKKNIVNYGALVRLLIQRYPLNHRGIHGVPHWMRVRANGLSMAEINGANSKVIELFAVFHDSQRFNDAHDPEHGARGAALAFEFWQEGIISLEKSEFAKLEEACCDHTHGGTEPSSITIATCWDADRLDLGRVGIIPNPRYLCTDEACDYEMLDWAYNRSIR